MTRREHWTERTPVEGLQPAQKVTVIVESAGQTIEATFSGDELECSAAYESTADEPPDDLFTALTWGPKHRFHLDVSIRRASNLNIRIVEEHGA